MTRLVTLAYFDTMTEARVARSMLEAYGFFAVLPDHEMLSNAWHRRVACGGIRLAVLEDDLADAVALLTAPEIQGHESDAWSFSLASVAWAPAALLVGVPHPVRHPRRQDSSD
jgi:hypothetical protein